MHSIATLQAEWKICVSKEQEGGKAQKDLLVDRHQADKPIVTREGPHGVSMATRQASAGGGGPKPLLWPIPGPKACWWD